MQTATVTGYVTTKQGSAYVKGVTIKQALDNFRAIACRYDDMENISIYPQTSNIFPRPHDRYHIGFVCPIEYFDHLKLALSA